MPIEEIGKYNGIPVYVDPNSEEDKILVLRQQESKPMKETRYPDPRTKGLFHSGHNIKAFIVHPSICNELIEGLNNYKYLLNHD
jgi:hypothetical protein